MAEISNSYFNGNGRHGRVATIPHLLDLYGNRVPAPGRPPAPGNRKKNLRKLVIGSYIRLSERAFCFAYGLSIPWISVTPGQIGMSLRSPVRHLFNDATFYHADIPTFVPVDRWNIFRLLLSIYLTVCFKLVYKLLLHCSGQSYYSYKTV